jgi:hypothetical protein
MKHRFLRESAKFLAGFVLGDFLTLCWLGVNHLLPIQFFGVTWTQDILLPGLLFDAGLILVLIHYGWNLGKTPRVRERTYFLIVAIIFAAVALLHLVRLFTGAIDVNIFGWDVPLWLSWIGVIITAYLSYMSFWLVAKMS